MGNSQAMAAMQMAAQEVEKVRSNPSEKIRSILVYEEKKVYWYTKKNGGLYPMAASILNIFSHKPF